MSGTSLGCCANLYLYNLCSLNHLGLHTVICNAEEAQKRLGGPVPCMHINFCTQDTSPAQLQAQLHVVLHVTDLWVGEEERRVRGERERMGRRVRGMGGRGRGVRGTGRGKGSVSQTKSSFTEGSDFVTFRNQPLPLIQ